MQKYSFFFVFLLMVFFIPSCFLFDNDKNNVAERPIMSDSLFKETVHFYEDEDRIDWQKPDSVILRLGDLSQKTVADIGAGTGYFSFRLLPKAKRVIATEVEVKFVRFMDSISVELPDKITSKLQTRLVKNTLTELQPDEVDIALMVNILHQIPEKETYLKALFKNIKAGGKIVVIDFKKKDLTIGPSLNEKIDVMELKNQLQNAGFQNISIDESFLDYQFLVEASK